jgi:CubicO group peptidase (beta-lactamase class C family)
VLLKGFGQRDIAKRLPVTPDTLFAIGSSTKAFTALSVLMAADDGKLSLDDSPKKYLPYFHMSDPETDKNITIRDLMCHRSGLARTDLAMVTGALNREELIRVAGLAKPTAKLGERFQYQNIMFTAAGEAAAQAEKTPYEQIVTQRIFTPLGMTHSVFSVAAMQHASDFSRGYQVSRESHKINLLPQRDISATAPAGAIDSSARDMARWLRFMLQGDGTFAGKRLVSTANFAELTKTQMATGSTSGYGLGWFLEEWNGHKVVQHGGNIDGFTTAVGLMPDRKLGYALLINDNNAVLGPQSLGMVWADLVGAPPAPNVAVPATPGGSAATTIDPATLSGSYSSLTPPISMEVTRGVDGVLTLTVAGQPPYPLTLISGNRYKLGSPAPDGFFTTFRPAAASAGGVPGIVLFLEQPQGNLTLTKEAAAVTTDLSPALRELTGDYDKEGRTLTLTGQNGKLTLLVPGQPAYPLDPSADGKPDTFTSALLPGGFAFQIQRDPATHKPTGLLAHQPNGDVLLKRLGSTASAELPTADELLAKMVTAYGGAANLRRHRTRVTTATLDFENQGITGEATEWDRAPDARATHLTLVALGKKIGTIDEYCDGKTAQQWGSFLPPTVRKGKALATARREADFVDGLLDYRTYDEKVEVKRRVPIEGEEAFVLIETPKGGGNPITDFVSAKSYLLLRRVEIDTDTGTPLTTTFHDYRTIDGTPIAFASSEQNPAEGTVEMRVKSVRFDVPVPEGVFRREATPTPQPPPSSE